MIFIRGDAGLISAPASNGKGKELKIKIIDRFNKSFIVYRIFYIKLEIVNVI